MSRSPVFSSNLNRPFPNREGALRRRGLLLLGFLVPFSSILSAESLVEAPPARSEIQVSATAWQASARIGEWVRIRTRVPLGGDRGVEVVQELRVQAVTEGAAVRLVTLAITTESGGNKEQTLQYFRVPPRASSASPPQPMKTGVEGEKEAGKAQLTVAGKTLKCLVRERTEPDGLEKLKLKTWDAPGVPCGGTVRIEHNGKAVFELLDFGVSK